MLGGIPGTGALYLLGLKTPDPRRAGGKDVSNGSEARARQSARQQEAAEALTKMDLMVQNQKQQRKAAAQAKVDRLKKELEALRMMGGDPKAVARRAAQIARELAAAAKEYASSGGSGMAAGGPAPSADGGCAEAAATAEAGKAAGEAGAQAKTDAAAPSAEASAAAQAAKAPAEGQAEAAGSDEKEAADKGDRPSVVQAFQELAADMAHKADEKKADSEFAA